MSVQEIAEFEQSVLQAYGENQRGWIQLRGLRSIRADSDISVLGMPAHIYTALARTFHQGSGVCRVAGETVWSFAHIHVLHDTGTPVHWVIVRRTIAAAMVGEGSAEM